MILMVAEKPSMARQISQLLVGNSSSLDGRPGKNKYCKNIHFPYKWTDGREVEIRMTSVLGHLFQLDFPKSLSNWREVPLESLFTAPITTEYIKGMEDVGENLKDGARRADLLVIWTDCDREGEYIGDEIRTICLSQNRSLKVLRARYSVMSSQELQKSIRNLTVLDEGQIEAARCRSELDLRTGAIFTRLQTLSIRDAIPCTTAAEEMDKKVISYGSCQFPTLGFVVEQYLKVLNFKEEEFWSIKLELQKKLSFTWERGRLFDRMIALILYEGCFPPLPSGAVIATVLEVKKTPTKKLKPLPLRTVELQKIASRLLKISSDRLMTIAEALYNKGYISYPRTETDQYDDPSFPFKTLIDKQKVNPDYCRYIQEKMVFSPPRKGKNNDKSHPPIHPTKGSPGGSELEGLERKVFDFIVCRFLASCSTDATGEETTVRLGVGVESFRTSGLVVKDRGFMDCYRWEKWGFGDSEALGALILNSQHIPSSFKLESGKTSAPRLLSESDLITCMDKNGIGTDATIHEHIKKVIERSYVIKLPGANPSLLPSNLGLSLVVGYDRIGLEQSLTKPLLRSDFERKLCLIADGHLGRADVMRQMVLLYEAVLRKTLSEIDTLLSVIRSNSSSGLYDGAAFGGFSGFSGGGNSDSDTDYPSNNNNNNRNNNNRNNSNNNNKNRKSVTVKRTPTASSKASTKAKRTKTTTKTHSAPCEKCSEECKILLVKKDGHNKGREFISCAGCNSFSWIDGGGDGSNSFTKANRNNNKISVNANVYNNNNSSNSNSNNYNTNDNNNYNNTNNNNTNTYRTNNSRFASEHIKCSCGLIAARILTKKKGPNEGRYFLQCSRTVKKCNFFEWE